MKEFVDIGFELNNQFNTLEMQTRAPGCKEGVEALVRVAAPWAQVTLELLQRATGQSPPGQPTRIGTQIQDMWAPSAALVGTGTPETTGQLRTQPSLLAPSPTGTTTLTAKLPRGPC